MKKKIFGKGDYKRLFILGAFYIVSTASEKLFRTYELELISSLIIIFLFSVLIVYEYKALFKKDLPKKEYFINIFFIVFFTILMFATVYSEVMHGGNSYFIENGKIMESLPYVDAIYFSTMTLATVGYGDIVPIGLFRLFTVIEVLMGLIYTGTMVYVVTSHIQDE